MKPNPEIRRIYKKLLKLHGPQGWWPLLSCAGCNPTKTGSMTGYHPHEYDWPKTERDRFEICIGTVLTQNTAWPNVEKALRNLDDAGLIGCDSLLSTPEQKLAERIRPAGYFNQKAGYLKNLAAFLDKKGSGFSRAELLAVKGIGDETADSILLYAFGRPTFVVDAYTKRIFSALGLIDGSWKYREIKELFEVSLPEDVVVFQEYHALIVEHAKMFYSKKRSRDPANTHDLSTEK